MNRVSTGLRTFDSELGGGIPSGGVVVIRAPPAAPIELLLGSFTLAEDVDGTYVTTLRSPTRVRRALAACAGARSGSGDVDDVSIVDVRAPLRESPVLVSTIAEGIGLDLDLDSDDDESSTSDDELGEEGGEASLAHAPDGGSRSPPDAVDEGVSTPVWVFDSLSDVLEADADWREFTSALAEKMESIGGVAYVFLRLAEDESPTRAEASVLDIASAVFEYRVDRREDTSHSLSVIRFIGGEPPSRRIPLEVSERLDVNPDRHM